jgi:hypothetical protein
MTILRVFELVWLASLHSVQGMSAHNIMATYVEFCKKHGIDPKDYENSLKLCIVLSLKDVHAKTIVADLQLNMYVDWDQHNLTANRAHNVFGGSNTDWIKLVAFLSELPEQILDAKSTVPKVLRNYYEMLHTAGIKLSFPAAACIFLLTNIKQLQTKNIVTDYCRIVLGQQVASEMTSFVSLQADTRFNVEDYSAGITWILSRCNVQKQFEHELQHYTQSQDSIQNKMKQHMLQVTSGRPRLKDRLQFNSAETSKRTVASVTQEAQDCFNGWCTRVRFPNNINVWLRQKLYFLQCQTFDSQEHIRQMLSADVADNVCNCKISVPEKAVINAVISRLLFHKQPFQELLLFRQDACHGFAQVQKQQLTYPLLLQLYTAAYQPKKAWKDHWLHIMPTISHTIITHVQKFVDEHPVNTQAIIETLEDS